MADLGTRAPTLRDIAREAGIAQITASRILNGNPSGTPIASSTRERVEQIARTLGYQPHAAARIMRQRHTAQVGVVVANDPSNPLTNLAAYEYILGINAGLDHLGIVVSLVRRREVEGERIRAFDERMFDALVVISHLSPADIERLRGSRSRVVWLDTNQDEAVGCLRRDEYAAGRAAAELLIARGRTQIWWLRRVLEERPHYSVAAREAGARDACAAAQVAFTPFPLAHDFASDAVVVERLLSTATAADGLLVGEPQVTRWVLYHLALRGLVPGRDVGLACCDGDYQLNLPCPGLSRVAVNREALGREAAAMVTQFIDQGTAPPSILVRSPVVTGETA